MQHTFSGGRADELVYAKRMAAVPGTQEASCQCQADTRRGWGGRRESSWLLILPQSGAPAPSAFSTLAFHFSL